MRMRSLATERRITRLEPIRVRDWFQDYLSFTWVGVYLVTAWQLIRLLCTRRYYWMSSSVIVYRPRPVDDTWLGIAAAAWQVKCMGVETCQWAAADAVEQVPDWLIRRWYDAWSWSGTTTKWWLLPRVWSAQETIRTPAARGVATVDHHHHHRHHIFVYLEADKRNSYKLYKYTNTRNRKMVND